MIDLTTLLVICCVMQSIIIAFVSATVPALWWLHVRASIKADADREAQKELRKDVTALDEVVDKLARAMNFNDVR